MSQTKKLEPIVILKPVKYSDNKLVFKQIEISQVLIPQYNHSKYLCQEEVSITAWSKVWGIHNGILINVVQRTFNKMMSAL